MAKNFREAVNELRRYIIKNGVCNNDVVYYFFYNVKTKEFKSISTPKNQHPYINPLFREDWEIVTSVYCGKGETVENFLHSLKEMEKKYYQERVEMVKSFRDAVKEIIEDAKKYETDEITYYVVRKCNTNEYTWTCEEGGDYPDLDWRYWEVLSWAYCKGGIKERIKAIREMQKEYYNSERSLREYRRQKRIKLKIWAIKRIIKSMNEIGKQYALEN